MFCSNCGTEMNENEKFCTNCGAERGASDSEKNNEKADAIEIKSLPDSLSNFSMIEISPSRKMDNISFYALTGIVLEYQRESSTTMSVSGGGGIITPYGTSYIEPIRSKSITITTDRFWVRTANGKEHLIEADNRNIRLRSGQLVSLIYAIPDGKKYGKYMRLVNHADGNKYKIMNTIDALHGGDIFVQWGVFKNLLALITVIPFVYLMTKGIIELKRVSKKLDERVNEIENWLVNSYA